MQSFSEYSVHSASQMLNQIHLLKSDLYESHIKIQDLKKENEELRKKLKDTAT